MNSNRYARSMEYLERAKLVTPGGAQTLSKQAARFPQGAYPVALQFGSGAHVTDIDGNEYLDFICGLASMTLGYGREEITEAVLGQLSSGVTFSLPTTIEAEVAAKLTRIIPCADMVRFVKTGSEATEAAIRVARRATGRSMIFTVDGGYHSWHSWFQATKPEHPGIPDHYTRMVHALPYNDLSAWEKAFAACVAKGHEIAAVILEPCHYEQPRDAFLQTLRHMCDRYGTLLIFDEMVTGFRWSEGGAQRYFDVMPDLATFGKACANGFPLAFLCGRRDLMELADVVSGTFGGEALSLAACNAVLDIYRDEPVTETLWSLGAMLQDSLNEFANDLDVGVVCDGYAVKPRIRFTDASKSAECMSLFLQELAGLGILWHPAGGNISAAMTPTDMMEACMKFRDALKVVNQSYVSGNWTRLTGKLIQQTSFVRKETPYNDAR